MSAQFRRAAANYDNQSPPEPAPERDYEEADIAIAATVEAAELVMEIREAAALFDWLAHSVDFPTRHLQAFRVLDRRVRDFDRRADAIWEAQS